MQTRKKVLFIKPALWVEHNPSYGLAMLSAVLGQQGHIVKVADYIYSANTPPVKTILADFQPDIIGISMYSSTKVGCEQIIDDIRSVDNATPILCGGPHITCATDELIENKKVDYLVRGEAEHTICDIVENAERQKSPVLVDRSPLLDIDSLDFPDYRTLIGFERMRLYPLLTSRGCPYSCSFCAAGIVSSKKYRPRRIDLVIEELKLCKERYKSVTSVFIHDDGFNIDNERGKELLRQLLKAHSQHLFNYIIYAGNFRADTVDEELLLLLNKLGTNTLWIGVESANEEVFRMIKKGETLEEISRACEMAKKQGMKPILNFIIGLPGDSFEKTYDSIRFAKKFKACRMFWSLLVVFKGTASYEWFKKNGTIRQGEYSPAMAYGSIRGDCYKISPNAYTTDFSSEDRVNVHKLARIITGEVPFYNPHLVLLYRFWRKYKVPMDILLSYPIFRLYKLETMSLFLLRLLFRPKLSLKLLLVRIKSHKIYLGIEKRLRQVSIKEEAI